MRRYLLATTAIATLTAIAAPAAAQTAVSTKRTDPLRTSTIKSGTPDAIRITSQGSVELGGGTAVTIDSNHSVTNEGAIAIANANGATGIVANAGTSGSITNTNLITIDETYTAEDADKDGDLDGPFAVGSNRFGIRTLGGFTGNVSNSGKIRIEGNDSGGIVLGGPLTGSFTHNGETSVLGNGGVGVRADAVSGNVRLAGTVSVVGAGSVGAHFSGDVGGAMVVQGAIAATGYRATTAPADPSKLDADDLLQGGSALIVEGSVAGGIVLAVPPKDSDTNSTDDDKDGIEDAKEGSAAVISYGAAPGMVIGGTRDITIGAVANTGTGFGLLIDGGVAGAGVYKGVEGNGLVIGGRGGTVSVANGMSVSGVIRATANGASATALRIGNGASVPEVRVSGTIEAKGGDTATSISTAVAIEAGATVGTLRNSGTISAGAAGKDGTAIAIVDRSGGLTLVENSGAISATGADAASARNVAIDLSANTSGVTVRQTQVASGVNAPSIAGDVRFGSGNDTFEIADGKVTGTVAFGGGANRLALSGDAVQQGNVSFGGGADVVTLAGTSRYSGAMDFGGGADTLTLTGTSRFSGSLANAGALAVTVTGGTLDLNRPSTIGSLSVGADGVLAVTLDKTAGSGTALTIGGTASFAKDSTLQLALSDVNDAEGRYVVLRAGTLSGVDGIDTDTDLLPFLFKGSLVTGGAANELAVDVTRRSATELGLNRSQAAAYDAIYSALGEDDDIADLFLGIRDGDQFRGTLRQMLPDHAGGAFEGLSMGVRTLARQAADPASVLTSAGNLNILLTAAGWGTNKSEEDTAAYDLGGIGASAGAELATGFGTFGATASYIWNKYTNGGSDNEVLSDSYELAVHWRGDWAGFSAFGRAAIGISDFHGARWLTGEGEEGEFERVSRREWSGDFTAFGAGIAYQSSGRFFFRPRVSIDYLKLNEDGYTDTGGGEGLDLTVAERTSDEFALEAGLVLGADLMGRQRRDTNWFRIEAEGGRRENLGGSLGATTASFEDGTPFTLSPDNIANGWYGRLRAFGGSPFFHVGGEFGAEEKHERVGLSLRGTVRLSFW